MAAGNKSSKIIIKPISLSQAPRAATLEPSLRQRGITSPEKTAIPMDQRSMAPDVMGIIGSERQQPGWDKARE
jgi:hypothetical protein